MRMRYHELVGKRVVSADGRDLGRVADLSAEPRDGRLFVTGLLVGPTALFRRIAFKVPVKRIRWKWVIKVGDRIHLRITEQQLRETPGEFD